jgi:hypothetical protein
MLRGECLCGGGINIFFKKNIYPPSAKTFTN